ncbi:MAG: methyltransferase domain-containing protein [Deltaproteobacteria bacterium]|nr:methyltransferase domain-containing protein [Deltaproteobacteria bacterium]
MLRMKTAHLSLLRCLECGRDLRIARVFQQGEREDEIRLGVLGCVGCPAEYPVIEGVAVFFEAKVAPAFLSMHEKKQCALMGMSVAETPAPLSAEQLKTKQVTDNWSFQWNEVARWDATDFEQDDFKGAAAFSRFIPLDAAEYRDRRVVVWCGGSGREAYHVSKLSPALLVVNDIGDELYSVPKLLGGACETLLLRCDMLRHPLKPGSVDVSICDHALQHVVDRTKGFQSLVEVLKPRGMVAICVYSRENNFLMTRLVEPSKKLLHRLPLRLLRAASALPAVALYALIHLAYVPARRVLPASFCKRLPLFEHMIFWSRSDLAFLSMACFDLLHAPVSHHFPREEVLQLAGASGIACRTLENTHGTTWSLVGTRDG